MKAKTEAEAKSKAKADKEAADSKARAEKEAKVKEERLAAENRIKAEKEAAELKAKTEAEAKSKAKTEAEAKSKAKADKLAAEAEAKLKARAVKEEAEAKADKELAELKARTEARVKANAQAEKELAELKAQNQALARENEKEQRVIAALNAKNEAEARAVAAREMAELKMQAKSQRESAAAKARADRAAAQAIKKEEVKAALEKKRASEQELKGESKRTKKERDRAKIQKSDQQKSVNMKQADVIETKKLAQPLSSASKKASNDLVSEDVLNRIKTLYRKPSSEEIKTASVASSTKVKSNAVVAPEQIERKGIITQTPVTKLSKPLQSPSKSVPLLPKPVQLPPRPIILMPESPLSSSSKPPPGIFNPFGDGAGLLYALILGFVALGLDSFGKSPSKSDPSRSYRDMFEEKDLPPPTAIAKEDKDEVEDEIVDDKAIVIDVKEVERIDEIELAVNAEEVSRLQTERDEAVADAKLRYEQALKTKEANRLQKMEAMRAKREEEDRITAAARLKNDEEAVAVRTEFETRAKVEQEAMAFADAKLAEEDARRQADAEANVASAKLKYEKGLRAKEMNRLNVLQVMKTKAEEDRKKALTLASAKIQKKEDVVWEDIDDQSEKVLSEDMNVTSEKLTIVRASMDSPYVEDLDLLGEVIMIKNPLTQNFDISNYQVSDDDIKHKWKIPEGTIIPPGATMHIYCTVKDLDMDSLLEPRIFWTNKNGARRRANILNNDGDKIVLRDTDGDFVSSCEKKG